MSATGQFGYESEKLPRPPKATNPLGSESGLWKKAGKLEETGRTTETGRVQPPLRCLKRRTKVSFGSAAGFEVEVIIFFFSRLVGGAAPAARSRQKFHVCSYAEEITHPGTSNHWQPPQSNTRKKR